MLALIDLSVIFIVAGCLLYFQNEKEPFLALGPLYRGDGSDACRQRRPDGGKSCPLLPLLWTTGCCSWPPGRARAAIKVWE